MGWFPPAVARDVWLRDARVPAALLDAAPAAADDEGLVRCDLRLSDGRIGDVAPCGLGTDGVSLDGGQVWPAFVDGHVHLDKTQIWARQPNPDGTHGGAKAAVMADRAARWTEADIAARFDFGLRCAWAHGTAAMRTHLDSYWPHARIGWRVFRALRDAWAGRIDLQAVSLCTLDRFAGDDGVALADEVAASGGLLGATTMGQEADFPALLERLFALAEARDLAVDLHLDETGDPGARALRAVAETALRRGFRRAIQVGHVCSLSMQDDAAATIRRCAEAGIAVVVLPMCNMYLQDRAPGRTPGWRGITRVKEFRAAGVAVSFASDNCRDPFYAYGDYDMLEVYREAVRIAQLDHPFGDWAGAVGAVPAGTCGFAGRGRIAVGAAADLVVFRARGMTELLARPQADRVVLRAGRVSDAAAPDFRELDPLARAPG